MADTSADGGAGGDCCNGVESSVGDSASVIDGSGGVVGDSCGDTSDECNVGAGVAISVGGDVGGIAGAGCSARSIMFSSCCVAVVVECGFLSLTAPAGHVRLSVGFAPAGQNLQAREDEVMP